MLLKTFSTHPLKADMSMTIDTLMLDPGADIFYDQAFRTVLDTNMNFLRSSASSTPLAIAAKHSFKYTGDLSSLLREYNIPINLHWVVMRMNNLSSPAAYSDNIRSLLIPKSEVVDRIRSLYMTQNRIKN